MSEQRIDKIAVQVEGKILNVIGKSFSKMLTDVKTITGKKYDGDNKLWIVPINQVQFNKFLVDNNLEVIGNESSQGAFFDDGEPDDYAITQSNKSKQETALAEQDNVIAKIYSEEEITAILDITEGGIPELNIDGKTLVRQIKATMMYYKNKVAKKTGSNRPDGLFLDEAMSLTLKALRMGINTTLFSIWEDSNGGITEHLSYKVSNSWINHKMPNCIIHTFELVNEEKLKYTSNKYTDNIEDKVYKTCIVAKEDAKDMRGYSHQVYNEYFKMNEKIGYSESKRLRDEAKNQAMSEYATVEGVGVVEAGEIYKLKYDEFKKDGKTIYFLKPNKNGEFEFERYKNDQIKKVKNSNPKGRGDDFKAGKRSVCAAAVKLGEIDLNNTKNQYSFSPDTTQFLVENTEYDNLPDDNHNKVSAINIVNGNNKLDSKDLTVTERTNLYRGDGEEEDDNWLD